MCDTVNVLQKSVAVRQDSVIRTLTDVQAVVQNQANTSFFPANANNDPTKANYGANPFPEQKERIIAGLRLRSLLRIITEHKVGLVDPQKIVNALAHGLLEIRRDSAQVLVAQFPIADICDLANADVDLSYNGATTAAAPDRAGSIMVAQVPKMGFHQLPDPIVLGPSQSFTAKLILGKSADLPTAANWVTAGVSGGLELALDFQIAEG